MEENDMKLYKKNVKTIIVVITMIIPALILIIIGLIGMFQEIN